MNALVELRRTFPLRALCCWLLCAGMITGASAIAKPWWMPGGTADDRYFLNPDVAFRVSAHLDGDLLHVRWFIADGYYLYRQRIQILAESADLRLGPVQLPRGTLITDEFQGTQEIYEQQVEATVRVTRDDYGAHPVQVKVMYQGCAKAGFCYPTIAKVLFPDSAAARPDEGTRAPSPWQLLAMLGGFGAFLVAGLRRRNQRSPLAEAP